MARLTIEELNNKINGLELDDDTKISLMEDVSDSLTNDESEELSKLRNELETAKQDFLDLKEKYKQRFLSAVETKEEIEEPKDLEEKEVIDIKEI